MNACFRPISKYIAKLWQTDIFLKKRENILMSGKDK